MGLIHLVLGKANPARMNGVNKVVFQLASRQAASGRDVQIWGITKDQKHNYEERDVETTLFKKRKKQLKPTKSNKPHKHTEPNKNKPSPTNYSPRQETITK